MTNNTDAYRRITEENLRLSAENIELKKRIEFQEVIYSELGIAFDDLKREKDIIVTRIQELIEKWRKYNIYQRLCADELEVVLKGCDDCYMGGSHPFGEIKCWDCIKFDKTGETQAEEV